jgi:hypothetical protein
MKARQFKQLAGATGPKRADLVVEGLEAIGANVSALASEVERCDTADARRASRLVGNVGTEEAGKFLILLDAYRSPRSDAATISRQFNRAQVHLPKLVYAQIADYSIGSQAELVRALGHLRPSHHLDGPNDWDWVFRNHLIMEREGSLYVDLVEADGELQWWAPNEPGFSGSVPRPMRLVEAIMATGLVSAAGLAALADAWDDFDASEDSPCWDWAKRTEAALDNLASQGAMTAAVSTARFVCDRWPMPMVELKVEEEPVAIADLEADRDAQHEAYMMREYGFDQ